VQNFILTFLVPVTSALGSASGGASVGGTLTVNGNGGTLGHVGGSAPMFTAIVDNADFMSLLGFDSSVTAAFGTAFTAAPSFGLPGYTQPIPGGVGTNIGIRLAFTLTDGDSASFTSHFEVVPVPEPTTALLLGAGLVALATTRRRAEGERGSDGLASQPLAGAAARAVDALRSRGPPLPAGTLPGARRGRSRSCRVRR